VPLNKFLEDRHYKKLKILVVGDLMLDHYIYGKVTRISPEAPVPVVEMTSESDMLGGCGNVIQNLNNLAVPVSVLSAVGNDKNGHKILDKLSAMGIETGTVYSSDNTLTNYKMRIVANNQHVVRVDLDNCELNKDIEKEIFNSVLELTKEVNAIIISDYAKGVCTGNIIQKIIASIDCKNKPVFVDPKGLDWKKYSGATFITPNIKEISSVIGSIPQSDDEFVTAGRNVMSQYEIKNCLITRGSDGMTFVSKNKSFHVSAQAKEVYDVSGAGDTVIACLTAAIIKGKSIRESVEFTNKAAGIVVGHVGTSAITLNELELQ